jgi:hypothetical protein
MLVLDLAYHKHQHRNMLRKAARGLCDALEGTAFTAELHPADKLVEGVVLSLARMTMWQYMPCICHIKDSIVLAC